MPAESSTRIPVNPLNSIALTCSGGGYRATSFHLGAMSYLHHLPFSGKPLLQNVHALSSVSGGTFTAVIYAQRITEGERFEDIYKFLLSKLRNLDLVELGLEKLNPSSTWTYPYKRKNLINAFAEIYDREFTNGETFEVFDDINNGHLKNVCFNATDFHHGFVFRFQNEGIFGNARFRVAEQTAKEVRLADIIAASSCFTGGFEPIAWPSDFIANPDPQKLRSTALMDGGIYDNQGIDGILLAERRVDQQPYDLIIVSDVTSPNMKPFEFAGRQQAHIWGTPNYQALRKKISRYANVWQVGLILVAILGTSLPFMFHWINGFWGGVSITLAVLAACLLVLTRVVVSSARAKMMGIIRRVQLGLQDQLPLASLAVLDLSRIPFGDLQDLVMDRLKALISLVGDVWLKVVRRLVYRQLYHSEDHAYRRTSNLIRELTREDYEKMIQRAHLNDSTPYFELEGCDPALVGSYSQVVSKEIELIANAAAGFGTNLWFTPKNEIEGTLNKLVMTGQISMCFNLLTYLTVLIFTPDNGFHDLSEVTKKQIRTTYDQCLADWKKFQGQPDFLFNLLDNSSSAGSV